MSTVFSAQNLSHMNRPQLRKAAIDAGVDPVVIYTNLNQNKGDVDNGRSAMQTAIKAK